MVILVAHELGEKITLSVIKADIGSLAGHHKVHPDTMLAATRVLADAKKSGLLIDYYVTAVGDDLQLIMTHKKGTDNKEIHGTAWNAFEEAAKVAKDLGLYAAGQDLLSSSFSGNIRGMGPGVAEMEFNERPAEPVVIFMADKTEPGAFNLPLYKIFADPFNTAGLVIDPRMHEGFIFTVLDVYEGKAIDFIIPQDLYDLLALIGTPSRYVVKFVHRKDGEIASVISSERLSLIAGKYIGKDDPVMIARAQSGFPALGEILEPFSFPHLVEGWMRGSHTGPLMPVGIKDAKMTRFDGPPRIAALGFNIKNGNLIGPSDLFDDVAYDETRRQAQIIAEYMRRHGPFMPHRLGPEDMEYTTLPDVLKKLEKRFRPFELGYKPKLRHELEEL